MGRLNRFLQQERPERRTIPEIAEILSAAIALATDRLIHDLETQGIAKLAPDRTNSVAFPAECLLLQAFPMDLIIAAEFGSYRDLIREKVAHRLFELVKTQGMPSEAEVEFHEVRVARFIEYAEALGSAEDGRALERLGAVAWENILGRREPHLIFQLLLAVTVTAMLKSYKGISAKFTVVQ